MHSIAWRGMMSTTSKEEVAIKGGGSQGDCAYSQRAGTTRTNRRDC
jgi:hypothetical protein